MKHRLTIEIVDDEGNVDQLNEDGKTGPARSIVETDDWTLLCEVSVGAEKRTMLTGFIPNLGALTEMGMVRAISKIGMALRRSDDPVFARLGNVLHAVIDEWAAAHKFIPEKKHFIMPEG